MTSISSNSGIKLEAIRPLTAKDVANAIPGSMSMLTEVKLGQPSTADAAAVDTPAQQAAAKAQERTMEAFAKMKIALQSKTGDLA